MTNKHSLIFFVLISYKLKATVIVQFFYFQDLPLGLMDDIYDWASRFNQRIDDLEEVSVY